MSCNGCRILRKGCNENCILRQSLQGIESSHTQANATVFVAKFFGRAGLMSLLSSVPESQRPACGRTVNPVHGAVGLLWTGNWHVCQSAVETVLKGGVLRPLPDFSSVMASPEFDSASEANDVDLFRSQSSNFRSKRKVIDDVAEDLDLGLTSGLSAGGKMNRRTGKRRAATASLNSDESDTTTLESGFVYQQNQQQQEHETKLLRLFF
ncbi:hypothetical protein RND71_041631 [Anisodus tanguticus]|uniref:LOB domain-containing protein n=1 Tax=Anisodus tanguticus TaxID=243964 RepID=A0AAE1QUH4_9SOLA|nr:hypothetical protein RND71_041631 [Anisodus tanguticus]